MPCSASGTVPHWLSPPGHTVVVPLQYWGKQRLDGRAAGQIVVEHIVNNVRDVLENIPPGTKDWS